MPHAASPRDHVDGCVAGGRSDNVAFTGMVSLRDQAVLSDPYSAKIWARNGCRNASETVVL